MRLLCWKVRLGGRIPWSGGASFVSYPSLHQPYSICSAGADGRVKNQINPGQNSIYPSGQTFDILPSEGGGARNHGLTPNDFPLHLFSNPNDNTSQVVNSTDAAV